MDDQSEAGVGKDGINFESSKLGTKKYWDYTYKKELKSFEVSGDMGEIWFGEESVLRVVRWLKDSGIALTSSILDIGCGNGIILSYLADEGFSSLHGIDYSEDAINLAKKVALKRGSQITYEVIDLIGDSNTDTTAFFKRLFDICHDKGTFDAISLSSEETRKRDMGAYVRKVNQVLQSKGLFIVTSCNFSEEELLHWFDIHFEKKERIPTPSFQYGGFSGSTVTTLVLQKRK